MKTSRCPTCHRLMKRSNSANSRYWLLLHLMADKLKPQDHQYSAQTWHTYAKMKWIGAGDVKLPNGKVITIPHSSAELDTDEFNDYMTKVEAFANEHGVFLDELVE